MKEKDRLNILFDQARSEKPIVNQDHIDELVRSGKKVSAKKIKLGKTGRGLFNPLNLIIMISTIAIITAILTIFSGKPGEKGSENLAEKQNSEISMKPEVRDEKGTTDQEKVLQNEKKKVKKKSNLPVIGPGIKKADLSEELILNSDTLLTGEVLHLTQEELSRLGFQFNDDGFLYLNKVEYGFANFYSVEKHPDEKQDPRGFGLNKKSLTPFADATNFSFFPSMITGVNGEELHEYEPDAYDITFFAEKNMDDLLVPVYFPGRWYMDGVTCDRLIWFNNIDDEFFDLLPEEKVSKTKERIDMIQDLQKMPGNELRNLVNFDFDDNISDRVQPLVLDENYLHNFGFRLSSDKIIYGYKKDQTVITLSLSVHGSNFKGTLNALPEDLERVGSFSVPMLGVSKFNGDKSIAISTHFYSDISDTVEFLSFMHDVTVPVTFQGDSVPEVINQTIFWFYPSEELFSSLPDSIGKNMRIEFDMNVAPMIQINHKYEARMIVGVRVPESILKKWEEEAIPCEYFPSFCEGLPGLDDLNIYPNPTTDNINIEVTISRGKSIDYRVFDISGRLMIDDVETRDYPDEGMYKQRIDLSGLEEGFYLLVLTDDEGAKMTRRLIKK